MASPKLKPDLLRARAEAQNLAGELPALLLEARRLAAAAPGVHGRRRAGPGEAFWQFREHMAEDGARAVDWRRSARGERLYVREKEKEAAQSALFWVDPDPGFAWASGPEVPTKSWRALTLLTAFAILAAKGGERVGALGGPPPRAGPRAAERLVSDLALLKQSNLPPAPPLRSAALFASDFYGPIEDWRARLKPAAQAGCAGALVMISDPAEEDFPFQGRVLFERPGGKDHVLFGKAEAAKAEYAQRLAAHRTQLRALAGELGFVLVHHRTDRSAAPTLALLASSLGQR